MPWLRIPRCGYVDYVLWYRYVGGILIIASAHPAGWHEGSHSVAHSEVAAAVAVVVLIGVPLLEPPHALSGSQETLPASESEAKNPVLNCQD